MADFSINATRMPEQQNTVGRDIVSPVQEQAITTNIVPALSDATSMFMTASKANKKADAEAQKQAVVGAYAKEQQRINDGIASGEIRPDRASTQSRALFGKYLAGYSMYADDLNKINSAMRTGSELGQAEDVAKSAADTQKARETAARANGATIYPWMDANTKETILQSNESITRAEREFRQRAAQNAETRSMSAEERTMADRSRKESAVTLLTTLAGNAMNDSSAFLQDLSSKVSQGTIPREQGELMLTQHFSRIEAALQSAAGVDGEMAGGYKSLFNDMKTLGMKSLDPKTAAEASKNAFDELMYREKLVAVTSDPKLKSLVAISALLPGNAVTVLGSLTPITQYLARAGSVDSSKGEGFVDPIVGNPGVEKDVLRFLQPAIKKVNEGSYKDNVKAGKEAVTTVNNILKQTADLQNDPSVKQDPQKLTDLAKFFAAPDFGVFVSKQAINLQAMQSVGNVWSATYDPAVKQAVQQRVKDWETSLASQSGGGVKGVTFKDAIDVKYDGSGISFVPKQGKVSMEPYQEKQRDMAIQELNSVKAGINQSIHIGTHLQKSTDYLKYWEAHKHEYLPSVFVQPVDKTTVSYQNEEAMKKAVVIQPSERQPDTQSLASNLAEIDKEIANTSNKTVKDILIAHRKTMTGGK